MSSKPIGGFFELELAKGQEFHPESIKTNSGRNSLAILLDAQKPKRVLLPRYSCSSVLDAINFAKVSYEYYEIDRGFSPLESITTKPGDVFLYINYFGINDHQVAAVEKRFEHVIIDNCQAFYCKPSVKSIGTFYSPRKFFGVADGGYLSTSLKLPHLSEDTSFERYTHNLKRIDLGPQEAWGDYKKIENSFSSLPPKAMSKLTQRILASINYAAVAKTRQENWQTLHRKLASLNELTSKIPNGAVPMVYPFLSAKKGLTQYLVERSVFVATYWPEVLNSTSPGSAEHYFANHLTALPIDQRYGPSEMEKIAALVLEFASLK